MEAEKCTFSRFIFADCRRVSPIFRYEPNKEMVANVVSPYMLAFALDALTRRGPSRKIVWPTIIIKRYWRI